MDIDLADALEYANVAILEAGGLPLKAPEIIILKGTWRGLTYGQMAKESEYSTNYLMRDIAPKLWKQLSGVFGRSVGKTNFRIVLENYVETRTSASLGASIPVALQAHSATTSGSLSHYSSGLTSSRLASSGLSSRLYGYEAELAQIKQYLGAPREEVEKKEAQKQHTQGCLIGIWGLNGIGKSLVCEAVESQIGDQFDAVVWQSLKRKPRLNDVCSSILTTLGIAPPSHSASLATAHVPPPAGQPVEQLLSVMAQCSILLIIEGADAILQSKTLVGDYLPEHQPYKEFFQAAASSRSSLLLTGTEGPADWTSQADYHHKKQSIYLTGLDEMSATALLADESLKAPEHWPELINRYQGHPLALQSAARVIREMFNGRVDTFLQQASVLFADIIRLLAPSFERLSPLELTILYWLASQKGPLSLADIQQTLPSLISSTDLISALDSLKQRSYLMIQSETNPPTFYLPPLIKAYALHRLMAQFKDNQFKGNQFKGNQFKGSVQSPAEMPLMATSSASTFSPPAAEPVITLSTPTSQLVRLNQWFQGRFESEWHPLSQLFEAATPSSTRLRNTYHLRDETFIKRCKSVRLGAAYKSTQPQSEIQAELETQAEQAIAASVVLVVAIRQKAESLCEVYVQVQPSQGAHTLPQDLELRLLDAQQVPLATVQALQADSFIQLPYFQGQSAEAFGLELALGEGRHAETFII
ncbi:MAG: DUF1822 family protein [Cyanobacteria bacterium J06597_16]